MVVSTFKLSGNFHRERRTCDALSRSVLSRSIRPEVEICRTSVSVKIRKIKGVKLIKQQILLLITSQFNTVCKDDSGYITQLKQQKSNK